MTAFLLALAVQTVLWFIPAEHRQTWPAVEVVESFPALEGSWQCGGYRPNDDTVLLTARFPCLAQITRTVLHEWGHRYCWQTAGDLSESCANDYAAGVLR